MTPEQMRRIRIAGKIGFLELAAVTGLPFGLLERIERREVVALERDLDRIEKALGEMAKEARRQD